MSTPKLHGRKGTDTNQTVPQDGFFQEVRKLLSPHFSHQVVAKRRKGRPDTARDRGPRKRTLEYVEEAEGYPPCGSRNAVRTDHSLFLR